MSIELNTTRCNQENLQKVVSANKIQTIAESTRVVGIYHITKKNYKDFYKRLRICCKIFGGVYQSITLEDIFNCVGLTTDAKFYKRSFKSFKKIIMSIVEREVDLEFFQELEKNKNILLTS